MSREHQSRLASRRLGQPARTRIEHDEALESMGGADYLTLAVFQSFATDLLGNLLPLIGVRFRIEPPQGFANRVAMSGLCTRFLFQNLGPEIACAFNILWSESSRVVAEDMELRLGGFSKDELWSRNTEGSLDSSM